MPRAGTLTSCRGADVLGRAIAEEGRTNLRLARVCCRIRTSTAMAPPWVRPKLAKETFRYLKDAAPFFLIAGPCVLESKSSALHIAETVYRIGERFGIPVVFKASFDKANRQSVKSPRGVGLSKGLDILQTVKDTFEHMLVTTDVHERDHCNDVAAVADILQIPAFLCRQTDLILDAAATGKLLNIKKGQFASADTMHLAAAKALRSVVDGGKKEDKGHGVLLTERGTMFGYDDLVFDPRNLILMRAPSHLVVQDATHSVQQGRHGRDDRRQTGGAREFVPTVARAAVAVGIDGLFLETHPSPATAICDRENQFALHQLEALVGELIDIAQASRG